MRPFPGLSQSSIRVKENMVAHIIMVGNRATSCGLATQLSALDHVVGLYKFICKNRSKIENL
jgi:glutathione peroxidase-family protein